MDSPRFDTLIRGLAAPASRRVAGRFLAGLGLTGVLAQTGAASVGAAKDEKGKKRKKPRKQKPKRNGFGCVDVGGFCANSGQCCSNICSGRKNKKTCQGHNVAVGTCEAGPLGFCGTGPGLIAGTPCTSSADENGFCFTTTGKAPFCAVSSVQDAGCVACKKDKDCQRFCGADAACIQCPACAQQFGVSTACAGVAADSCVF
jgi:hypothetical protein